MNIFLEPSTEQKTVRIPQSANHAIAEYAKARGMKESQYLKLAIQNQINADCKQFTNSPTTTP